MSNEESLMKSAGELANDPDCNINITPQGPINYYYAPSPDNIQDANKAISQLTYENIWKLPPFRMEVGTITQDIRAVIEGGGRNWQIYVNGINGNCIIASVMVQENLATASSEKWPYILSMVKRAFELSINKGQVMNVNGPCR